LAIGVDAHIAEIDSEARLKKATCSWIERLAGRTHHFVDGGWISGLSRVA